MNKLDQAFEDIRKAFQDDFIEKLKIMVENAMNDLDNKYCICGDNRNHHANGEGGSPSPCECEDCLCNEYHFSLIKSLFADRDEFLQSHTNAMDYPHIKLMIAIQCIGFNSELLDIIDNIFTWNGDPATKSKKEIKI